MEPNKPGGDIKRPGGQMNPANPQETTKSQLLPLGSTFGEIAKKPYFVPGVVVAVMTLLLFQFAGSGSMRIPVKYLGVLPVNVPVYSMLLATLITAGSAFALYRMIGNRAAWWVMPCVIAFMAFVVESPLMSLFHSIYGSGSFRVQDRDSMVTGFIKMVFGAGLPEETLKAIPVAIGVWLALKIKDRSSPMAQFRVAEPLDGILIGVASGLGFAFTETLFQYVPAAILGGSSNAVALAQTFQGLLDSKVPYSTALAMIQKLMPTDYDASLRLLIPRLIGEIAGHACYSGIFGYYIGLAFMRPTQRVKTILIGLAIAVAIHSAWDSLGSYVLQAVLAVGSFLLLAAVIVKARQISPNRSQLVASQILDRFSRVHSAPVAPAPSAAAAPQATPANSPRPAVSMTWDDASNLLVIQIGTARVPATPGAHLYARQTPGAEAMGDDGIVGEVNANPNDSAVLGLKNLSKQTWEVTTDRGEKRELAPGRSVRLARGTRILIGDLYADVK